MYICSIHNTTIIKTNNREKKKGKQKLISNKCYSLKCEKWFKSYTSGDNKKKEKRLYAREFNAIISTAESFVKTERYVSVLTLPALRRLCYSIALFLQCWVPLSNSHNLKSLHDCFIATSIANEYCYCSPKESRKL